MPVKERIVAVGHRRGEHITRQIGSELRTSRRIAGLSQGTLGEAVGLSRAEVSRIERGCAPWLTVIHASELLSAVGLELWAKAYPAGPRLRDAGHLRLLADFEARLHRGIRRHREWIIPGDGSHRAVDLLLTNLPVPIGVEAETVLEDLQALEREINVKQRDAGLDRMILLVRGSRRNRDLLRGADALHRSLPLSTRSVLSALALGRDPGGNGLVIL